jgi:hypothetical protein
MAAQTIHMGFVGFMTPFTASKHMNIASYILIIDIVVTVTAEFDISIEGNSEGIRNLKWHLGLLWMSPIMTNHTVLSYLSMANEFRG